MLHLTYSLFVCSFFLSFMLSVAGSRCLVLIGGGVGVEDSYIKKGLFKSPPPHTPFAKMSSLAPSCELAVAPDSWSDVVGCRLGSMHTSLHTSVRRLAVRSRISLCLMEGKPPLAHESACSTVKLLPQSHLDGRFEGDHPYRRAMASWKAALCSEKPCSLRGRAVSQVEAPFSLARSTAFCCCAGNWP